MKVHLEARVIGVVEGERTIGTGAGTELEEVEPVLKAIVRVTPRSLKAFANPRALLFLQGFPDLIVNAGAAPGWVSQPVKVTLELDLPLGAEIAAAAKEAK